MGKPGCDYCGQPGARSAPYKDGNVTVYAHPACHAAAWATNGSVTVNEHLTDSVEAFRLASIRVGLLPDDAVLLIIEGSPNYGESWGLVRLIDGERAVVEGVDLHEAYKVTEATTRVRQATYTLNAVDRMMRSSESYNYQRFTSKD